MQTLGFPGCCTAAIVTGFGQETAADVRYRPTSPVTEGDINSYLQTAEDSERRAGGAVLTITLTSRQTLAAKVLKARGYKHSKWMSKGAHRDTKLRLYWLPLRG